LTARDGQDDNPLHADEVTPGYGTLQAEWPQAASSEQPWVAWNKAVESAALQAGAEGNMPAAPTWNNLVQPGVDQSVTAIFERLDGEMVSVTINNFVDGHGAHPNHDSVEFHWLLDQQRELKPEDVFVPNSGWNAWMQDRLDRYLRKALNGEPDNDSGIVTNPRSWRLETNGLTLFFNPYQVSCYACTPEPLTIPWTDLKPYLQPSFTPPH
jgi:hypothetical protein